MDLGRSPTSLPVVVLSAVVNVITDIYVLVLPIPRVLQLQVRGEKRLGLVLVFATGVTYVVKDGVSMAQKRADAMTRTCGASLTRMIVFCVHYSDPSVLWVQARNAQFTYVLPISPLLSIAGQPKCSNLAD